MSAEYLAQHRAVYKKWGGARRYTCKCGEPAKQWAWIHDTDRNDPDNYEPMCVPCHKAYDSGTPVQKRAPGPSVWPRRRER